MASSSLSLHIYEYGIHFAGFKPTSAFFNKVLPTFVLLLFEETDQLALQSIS